MDQSLPTHHEQLKKENPAAGELWRGGVSKMKTTPDVAFSSMPLL
jgi:hypothetical protein